MTLATKPQDEQVRVGATRRVAPMRAALVSAITPIRALLVVVLFGGLLSLYRYDALSLWLDEGITIYHADMPWPVVLGFQAQSFDPHPPLYFILVKLFSLVAPALHVSRLISVVAGTLTIPVLYGMAAKLLPRWMAVAAGAALAVSPLHIWYSQEARPYALAVLLVALSYLALVAFYKTPATRWAVLYGLSTLLSLYVSYSAIYALAPQIALVVLATKTQGRRSVKLWAAGLCAVLSYVPWLWQLVGSMQQYGSQREGYLGVTPEKIGQTFLSVVGVSGNGSYFWGGTLTPWERWANWQAFLLLGIVLALVLGALALLSKSATAVLVAGSLLLGTVGVGAPLSLISPGYAERTILCAVLGWALVLGALPFARPGKWLRILALLSTSFVLALTVVSLFAIYRGDKQHWRDLATDTAVAATFGMPILTYPTLTEPIIEIYEPHALDANHIGIGDGSPLPTLRRVSDGRPLGAGGSTRQGKSLPDALWFSYLASPGFERPHADLAALGYQRIMHQYYWHPLYLDLYVMPGVRLGSELSINGQFEGDSMQATGWVLPKDSYRLLPSERGGRQLTLKNDRPGEIGAYMVTEAKPQSLYTLEVDVRSQLQSGGVRGFLICRSQTGSWRTVAPDSSGATVPNDRQWHTVTVAALCPSDTGSVMVDLRNAGLGEVSFRNVKLREARGEASQK